jgi:hypothetical protein
MMCGMEDEAYARELLAILTNPQPTGIDPADPYGQADDGIDRYDGFGRDFWVESVAVAAGEHGPELLVEYGLAVPPDPDPVDVAQHGTLRLAFDSEWRDLSGYEDPAAYAPVVAGEVGIAVGRQLERQQRDPTGSREVDEGRPALGSDARWQILLAALSQEGAVREVAPGRIEVRGPEGAAVNVVVTPRQWEQVLADHVGDDVDLYFAELLGPRQDDETFLVFCNGDLVRSTREKLPPVRGRALEREISEARAEHPLGQVGWHAYPPNPTESDR